VTCGQLQSGDAFTLHRIYRSRARIAKDTTGDEFRECCYERVLREGAILVLIDVPKSSATYRFKSQALKRT
jgi:hypothetical protein